MEGEAIVEKNTSPQHQKKKEHKKKEKKVVKHERPAEYQRNADLITPDTQLQPLPKKHELIPKPEIKDFQERQAKNREKITKLIEKKKEIRTQKFKPTKTMMKGEGDKHDDLKAEFMEFKDLKEHFFEVRKERNAKRDLLTKLIDQAKENNNTLKNLKDASKNSKESIEEKLERLEHRLITADLTKQEEKDLNNEIMIMKRKLKDAESVGNIEVKIAHAEERKTQLNQEIDSVKAQKEPLEEQYKQLKAEMDKKNDQIKGIKDQLKNEAAIKTQTREKNNQEFEDWKEKKKKRLDETEAKIKTIDAENKKIWDEYHSLMDKFWEQKHKVDFLEWQHRVKKRKVENIQREKRREIAIQKEKQREKEEQLKKYIKEIQLCGYLTGYLNELTQNKEENAHTEAAKTELTKEEIAKELKENSQWKKEKGLEVIKSKKNNEDEQPAKKGKKNKKQKKEEEVEEKKPKFEIPYNIQTLFENLKLLAPASAEQIPEKIKELKEREALFERACEEQVSEEDKNKIEEIKNKGKGHKSKKGEKKQAAEQFPTL